MKCPTAYMVNGGCRPKWFQAWYYSCKCFILKAIDRKFAWVLYCYRECKTFFKDIVWENNILSSQKQPALKQKHIVYIVAFQHFRLVLTKPGSCCVCSTMLQQPSRQAYANMSSFPRGTPSYTRSHYFYSSVKSHICTLKLNFYLLFRAGIARLSFLTTNH